MSRKSSRLISTRSQVCLELAVLEGLSSSVVRMFSELNPRDTEAAWDHPPSVSMIRHSCRNRQKTRCISGICDSRGDCTASRQTNCITAKWKDNPFKIMDARKQEDTISWLAGWQINMATYVSKMRSNLLSSKNYAQISRLSYYKKVDRYNRPKYTTHTIRLWISSVGKWTV